MRIFLISWFLAYSFIGKAQNKQNVFIQSNPSQFFFAELNGNSYTSNAEGFILLPAYDTFNSLVISFPNQPKEQFKFNFEDKKNIGGYFLHKTSYDSWQLTDLSNEINIIGIKIEKHQNIEIDSLKFAVDKFSKQLANAINDQDIRDLSYIIKTEKIQSPIVSNQSIIKSNTISIGSDIKLIYQDAFKMVFVDKTKKQVDTIIITFDNIEAKSNLPAIKNDTTVVNTVSISKVNLNDSFNLIQHKEMVVKLDADSIIEKTEIFGNQKDNNKKIVDSSVNNLEQSIVKNDSVQLDGLKMDVKTNNKDTNSIVETPQILEFKIMYGKAMPFEASSKNLSNKKDTIIENQNRNSVLIKDTITQAKRVIKTGCRFEANERDLVLFRRKLILMNNQKELLFFASKEFKERCYTTLLIRNLSFIFLNDMDKFQFFKLAYSNVSDPENFGTLERFLNDEQEILKFKNLINKQ